MRTEKYTKAEINKILTSQYHQLNEIYPGRVVAIMLYGSQNYDIDVASSDVDTRAIVLPSFDDIVLGSRNISRTTPTYDGLCDVKAFSEYAKLIRKQNPSYIEPLFSDYMYVNPVYAEEFTRLMHMRNDLACYNTRLSLDAIYGTFMQKYKRIKHEEDVVKAGQVCENFTTKNLIHAIRMYHFYIDYATGCDYKQSLTKHHTELVKLREELDFSEPTTEYVAMANKYYELIKAAQEKYRDTIEVRSNRQQVKLEYKLNNIVLSAHRQAYSPRYSDIMDFEEGF